MIQKIRVSEKDCSLLKKRLNTFERLIQIEITREREIKIVVDGAEGAEAILVVWLAICVECNSQWKFPVANSTFDGFSRPSVGRARRHTSAQERTPLVSREQ